MLRTNLSASDLGVRGYGDDDGEDNSVPSDNKYYDAGDVDVDIDSSKTDGLLKAKTSVMKLGQLESSVTSDKLLENPDVRSRISLVDGYNAAVIRVETQPDARAMATLDDALIKEVQNHLSSAADLNGFQYEVV